VTESIRRDDGRFDQPDFRERLHAGHPTRAPLRHFRAADQEIETLRANGRSTALTLTGNEFNNAIHGGGGSDTLTGGAGGENGHSKHLSLMYVFYSARAGSDFSKNTA
jgi:hypothetical protein